MRRRRPVCRVNCVLWIICIRDKRSLSRAGFVESRQPGARYSGPWLSRTGSLEPAGFRECRSSSLTPKAQSVECHSVTGWLSIICRSHEPRAKAFESFLAATRVIGFAIEGTRTAGRGSTTRTTERIFHRAEYRPCVLVNASV